jgi:hypothetical protein
MLDFEGFMQTNPLWEGEYMGLHQFKIPDINLTTFTPADLPTKLRLGHRIEHIFGQLITHSHNYEVVVHNLQIQKEKITQGELDFILREHQSQQYIHVELSYKFYIIDPSLSVPIQRAMGPNRKDQFFTKMNKTKDKQLPIVYSSEGREALLQFNITPEELSQQCCFLGQLFVPYKRSSIDIAPFKKRSVVGFWLGLEEFSSVLFSTNLYYIPTKPEWLHVPHANVNWRTQEEIIPFILTHHTQERAPMLWIRNKEGFFEKCFVVWWPYLK